MSKARLVITAVVVEGRKPTEVAEAYGVSRSWLYELLARWISRGELQDPTDHAREQTWLVDPRAKCDRQARLRRSVHCTEDGLMRVHRAHPSEIDAVIAMPVGPGVLGMTKEALRAEFDAGRMRPEWTWVAVDDEDRIVGRALWWGRDGSAPIALDVLDTVGHVTSSIDIGSGLLRAGHDALAADGYGSPLPHTVRLPMGWRDRPTCIDAVEWRTRAAAGAGLTQVNERLQVEWSADDLASTSPDPSTSRFTLRSGTDEEFLDLFVQAARGSLDVMTQRSLAATSVEETAQDDLDFYLSCPGERDWWRVAVNSSRDRIGFVIPSATPYARNVGYLGVLPEHRGQGHVDKLVTYVTQFHQAAGATRITATTDAVNRPMAAAFARNGYRTVETRIDLEAPAG